MKILCTAKLAGTTIGHIDHAMAYAAGFQQLGHEVYLMEQVGSGRLRTENGDKVPFDSWSGRAHFEQIARAYGLWPRCCLIYKQGQATHGLSFQDARRIAKECDLLVTRSGQISRLPAIFEAARCRVYIDGNPGSTQYQCHATDGAFEALREYQFLFTMGLNVGGPVCPLPTDVYTWHPILRPVLMSMWPVTRNEHAARFTTISTWKGRGTFQWDGRDSGEKSSNWLQFIELPARTTQALEIALRTAVGDTEDRRLFTDHGWHLSDPATLRNIDDYRHYIAASRGEFSVAHNRYVAFRTGWFSDRSALYLAAGRPVIVQSTGLEQRLLVGTGLLTFTTLDEAAAAIETVNRDYLTHCRAARALAEEYFDARKVLSGLLARIGLEA